MSLKDFVHKLSEAGKKKPNPKYNQCEIVWQPLECEFQPTDGTPCKYFMNGQCNPDKIVWNYMRETFINVGEETIKEIESK